MFSIAALTSNEPVGWSTRNYDSTDYSLVTVGTYSSDYINNALKVKGNFNNGIKSIQRVENPFLYGRFLLKKEEYKSRGINFTIKELFHDTAEGNVSSIVRHNFDWRLTTRAKFGLGVSFSPCPTYANRQSSRSNGTDRAMIVTDVIVGVEESGSPLQSLPVRGDTTVGNTNNVYVKYFDDEFFPKYVVNYQSAPQEYYRRFRF